MKYIWAKTMLKEKIKNDYTLKLEEFDIDKLYDYLKEICYNLKIETPLILPKHKNHLLEFGTTKFVKEDFIDYINFDKLILQYYEQ